MSPVSHFRARMRQWMRDNRFDFPKACYMGRTWYGKITQEIEAQSALIVADINGDRRLTLDAVPVFIVADDPDHLEFRA